MPVDSDHLSVARRINLGCGPMSSAAFINCDRRMSPGLDLCCDVTRGLPFADGSIAAIVAVHLLQDLEWAALLPALTECRRVLQPGGWLRVLVPDLERAIDACRRDDAAYFHVPDHDARLLGAKLVTQAIWYGSVRTPMTWDFIAEWLARAGFIGVRRLAFGVTDCPDALLASLDNRERESLCVEARR
jgi:SAM-dependent methyltransferase